MQKISGKRSKECKGNGNGKRNGPEGIEHQKTKELFDLHPSIETGECVVVRVSLCKSGRKFNYASVLFLWLAMLAPWEGEILCVSSRLNHRFRRHCCCILSSPPVGSRGWITERAWVCANVLFLLLLILYFAHIHCKPFSDCFSPFQLINRFSVHSTKGTSCNRFMLQQFRDFRWI